ncbi:MAG: hypothetical protein ACYSTL_08685 [Planctomycetota bacterium]|jgi:hypothetical protein
MPISLDFEAIVAPFEAPFQKQLSTMAKSFERIGKILRKRLGKLRPADRETSDIPVVGFSGDAIRVSIDTFQHGALRIPPSAPESRVVRAGAHFVDGVAQIGRSARQEWILPGLIGTFADAVGAIVDSMRRFEVARPEMFDPRGTGRASDFIGIAALFVRAFATSARETTTQSRMLRKTLQAGRGSSAPGPEPAVERTQPSSLLETLQSFDRSLEQGTRWITGAILLLPLHTHSARRRFAGAARDA